MPSRHLSRRTVLAGALGASATLAGGLQVNAPAPTFASISPTSVVQGATGTTITLTGTNDFGQAVSTTATTTAIGATSQARLMRPSWPAGRPRASASCYRRVAICVAVFRLPGPRSPA